MYHYLKDKKMKYLLLFVTILFISNPILAGKTEDRNEILKYRQETLTRLYKEEPQVKAKIAKAAGYATFSNIGINVVFISAGGGSGVVHDNKTSKDTYMSMATAGVGIGLGIKDFRAVFVFNDQSALKSFIEDGWNFSGQADAAAKSGRKGKEGSAAGSIINGVDVYQMTETGLTLQATLQGTKYWVNKKLN